MAGDAYDLDAFAPRPITFKIRDVEWRIDSDPDVDVVARMLRIENEIQEAEGIDATVASTQEGKQLLLEMIRDFDPGQVTDGLKLGAQDVLLIFALIMHGSSVAEAVARAMSSSSQDGEEADSPVATRQDGGSESGLGGDELPLALGAPSSERSSSSDVPAGGRPATGSV